MGYIYINEYNFDLDAELKNTKLDRKKERMKSNTDDPQLNFKYFI